MESGSCVKGFGWGLPLGLVYQRVLVSRQNFICVLRQPLGFSFCYSRHPSTIPFNPTATEVKTRNSLIRMCLPSCDRKRPPRPILTIPPPRPTLAASH